MNPDTEKQVVGRYSDEEKSLARKFLADTSLYKFVKQQLLQGVTSTEQNSENIGAVHTGWLNQLAVKHIGIPLQNGEQVNREAFNRESEAIYAAINLLQETFARLEMVANHKEEVKEVKKKPTLK